MRGGWKSLRIISNRRLLHKVCCKATLFYRIVSYIYTGIAGVGRCCDPHDMAHCILALRKSIVACKVARRSHSRTWTLHACAIDCIAKHTLTCTMTSCYEYLPQNVRQYPGHWASSTCRPGRHETRFGPHWKDCR